MGKRTKAEYARCPWYCSETPQKIYCEGLEPDRWIHMAFQSAKVCKDYKVKYCRGDYALCPYATLHKEDDMQTKYGNIPVVINGRRYASQREARRAQELQLLQKAGKIKDLREQVRYELIPAQSIDGKLVEKSCSYIADFVYTDISTGNTVVEDAKGHATDVYKIKKKLMLWKYNIRIKET